MKAEVRVIRPLALRMEVFWVPWAEAQDGIGGSKTNATEGPRCTVQGGRQSGLKRLGPIGWHLVFLQYLKVTWGHVLAALSLSSKLDQHIAKESLFGPHPGVPWSQL